MLGIFVTFAIPMLAFIFSIMTIEWWVRFTFGFPLRPTTKNPKNENKNKNKK